MIESRPDFDQSLGALAREAKLSHTFHHLRALSGQRGMASFYPRLSIRREFLHRFEQTIGVRVGDAAGEVIFAIIPFHSATIEIGGQHAKAGSAASRARNVL